MFVLLNGSRRRWWRPLQLLQLMGCRRRGLKCLLRLLLLLPLLLERYHGRMWTRRPGWCSPCRRLQGLALMQTVLVGLRFFENWDSSSQDTNQT